MHTLTLPAPAKLNLFLHINGRRADGYHNLQTVFQILDYGDELSFSPRRDDRLLLHCEGPESRIGVAPRDNLVLRAAHLLREQYAPRAALPGMDIKLHKRLPTGGGLGGGSSDAATTLLALNRLWALNLDARQLLAVASRLGADVPVFVGGHSAWAEGIGDRLEPIDLPERWYLVVTPDCHVATAEVFGHPELTRDSPAITIAAFFAGDTRNDCENLVRRLAEPVHKVLNFMDNFGDARMTGSGSSVFLAFAEKAQAETVARQIPGEWRKFVARGVNRSPVLSSENI